MTLTLPWPPSSNTHWRHVIAQGRSKTLISAKGRAYRSAVRTAAIMARVAGAQLDGPLAVTLEASPPDRRRRDLDNMLKALLDACTHAGLWLDDSQIDDLRIVRCPVVAGGHMQVTVTQLEDTNNG